MIERFPDEKEGYFYLGKVFVEDEQYDKAIEIFRNLLERKGESAAQAHVELGGIYAIQKQYSKSEDEYRQALSLDPFNLAARLNLAQVLANQKKFGESYQTLEELSKLAPSNLGIQIKMALLLAEQKQFDKARDLFDKILQSKPGWDQVRFHLGRVLREQGKSEEAEREFIQIQKGQPSFVNSRIVLTLMFLNLKDFTKALKYVDEAVEEEPKDPEIYHIKGSILEELFRFNESIKEYKKALELSPDNIKLMYSLGNAYEKSG
jgi:tetratricopeptide (TPR) repeat protein